MKRNNAYRILQENMRRFKTKNLNETYDIHSANLEHGDNWSQTFMDFPRTTDAVDLINWWSDVFADMGPAVLKIAKQIEMGDQLANYKSELTSIMNHTNKCTDKIKLIAPNVYNQIKDDVILLDMIKDDLVEEIKKLVSGTRFDEVASITAQLEKIANSYTRVSNWMLEQSWDSAESEYERIDTKHNAMKAAASSGVQNITYKKPTGKTPWPNYSADHVDVLMREGQPYYMLIRSKYLEGYSLKEIFDWWMNVFPNVSTYIGTYNSMAPLRSFLPSGMGTGDPALINNKQYNQFYDYIKMSNIEAWRK